MDLWFTEDDNNAIRYSYAIEDVLYRGRSEFQTVDVIMTKAYGKMLLIDGLVMITENDEFVYHEMIAHIPALLHQDPKRVVVIGGGDGGTVRELLKHPEIEKVTLCEIDEVVVKASKEFFPEVAGQLDDPRVEVLIGDGVKYMADAEDKSFDIVVVDSTDPISVGEGLFSKEFYGNVARSLKNDGYMVCQSESPWYKKEMLKRIQDNVGANFSHVKPYLGLVPTYPRGSWSWTIASQKDITANDFSYSRLDAFEDGLKYLNAGMLPGVFALPTFFSEKLT